LWLDEAQTHDERRRSEQIGEGREMSVRWDEVVNRAAVDIGETPSPLPQSVTRQSAGCIEVHLRLFGALACMSAERSFRLKLPITTTIADVLAIVGERLGEGFLAQVLDETGSKRRYCRLFVGGYSVEDLQTPLSATIDPSEIDIILLIVPEGG
jgi:hypothetical protein